jgi:hypothetical protein
MNKEQMINALKEQKAQQPAQPEKVETFAEWFKRECAKPLKHTIVADATAPEVRLVLKLKDKSYLKVFTDIIEARKWFKDNIIKYHDYQAYVDRAGRLNIFITADIKQQPKAAPIKTHQMTM